MFRGNAIDESYIMVLKLTFLIFLMRTAINICTILASCKKVPALYYPEYAFKFILNWVILITLAGGIATFCVTTMIHYFIDVKISTIFFGLSVLSILALIGFVRFMEFSYNLLDAARKHLEVIQAATPAVVYSVENVD
uniref:Uncharacterized protein n=1 Tax=Acrobeloides nanus TaxID=290746 RepID=A0A914C3B9_9BILA